jgi:hypothetical protein
MAAGGVGGPGSGSLVGRSVGLRLACASTVAVGIADIPVGSVTCSEVGWPRSCGVRGTETTGVGVGVDEAVHPINARNVNKSTRNLIIHSSVHPFGTMFLRLSPEAVCGSTPQ